MLFYISLSLKFSYLKIKKKNIFQNVLAAEGAGFKIAMGAFDKTRPPVRFFITSNTILFQHFFLFF